MEILVDNDAQLTSPQDQEQEQDPTQTRKDSVNAAPHETPPTQETRQQVADIKRGEGDAPQQQPSLASEDAYTPAHITNNNSSVGQTDFNFFTLQPDDINFPKLQTPNSTPRRHQEPEPTIKSTESQFVWKSQHAASPISTSQVVGTKGKGKLSDSTPITRQGYRTGRLAEDFWSSLGMPNIPTTNSKKLRVIPFLTKNRHIDQAEYLVDSQGPSFGAIANVHIAEVLAGIPWTQTRARQHVVDEVSHMLYKLLIFNNNISNPFQRWSQGQWYAQWGQGTKGESICTLYVSIDVPEQKVKPRKGNNMSWRKEPVEVSLIRASPNTEDMQPVEPENTF